MSEEVVNSAKTVEVWIPTQSKPALVRKVRGSKTAKEAAKAAAYEFFLDSEGLETFVPPANWLFAVNGAAKKKYTDL